MARLLNRVRKDETGASAAEYALLVSLIAVALIVGVGAFGTAMNTFFSGLAGQLGFGG